MDESLNQSMSVKKPSKKIKKKKFKYMNLTIALLIIHCACILIQKHLEHLNIESELINKRIIKDFFLAGENVGITIFIIILLCNINNNLLLLCSILYFLIGIIMIFYLIINQFIISNNEKNSEFRFIFIYILNNILFFVEGYLIFSCSEIIEKEKMQVNREKYGYKNDDYMLREEKFFNNNGVE